jgi:hypothetical protein
VSTPSPSPRCGGDAPPRLLCHGGRLPPQRLQLPASSSMAPPCCRSSGASRQPPPPPIPYHSLSLGIRELWAGPVCYWTCAFSSWHLKKTARSVVLGPLVKHKGLGRHGRAARWALSCRAGQAGWPSSLLGRTSSQLVSNNGLPGQLLVHNHTEHY